MELMEIDGDKLPGLQNKGFAPRWATATARPPNPWQIVHFRPPFARWNQAASLRGLAPLLFESDPPMSDTVIQPRPAGHPLAGQRMTGARMLMQVLADE